MESMTVESEINGLGEVAAMGNKIDGAEDAVTLVDPSEDDCDEGDREVGEEITLEAANSTLAAMAEEKARDASWRKQVDLARTHSRSVREAEVEAFSSTRSIRKMPSTIDCTGGLLEDDDSLPEELTVSRVSVGEYDDEREDNEGSSGVAYYQLAIAGGAAAAAAAVGANAAAAAKSNDTAACTVDESNTDKPKATRRKQNGFFRSLKKSVIGKKASAKGGCQERIIVGGGPDATICMISGCQDRQYSSDVQDISAFRLPDPAGRSGGACTSALLKVLYAEQRRQQNGDALKKTKRKGERTKPSFVDVLTKMREELIAGGYDQIPQLTASRPVNVQEPFHIVPPSGGKGTARALLVGINYVGQRGELSGCHNDVINMKGYLTDVHGFDDDGITILMDDDEHPLPTRANILEAWRELVEESEAGDSVFFHYSGHGGKVRDDDQSEEDDGYDETICPVDFQGAGGQIRDDDINDALVRPMAAGVTVTCLMDSCHSGTVLDLPYKFKADGSGSKEIVLDDGGGFLSGERVRRVDASVEGEDRVGLTTTSKGMERTQEPISDSEADGASCGASI